MEVFHSVVESFSEPKTAHLSAHSNEDAFFLQPKNIANMRVYEPVRIEPLEKIYEKFVKYAYMYDAFKHVDVFEYKHSFSLEFLPDAYGMFACELHPGESIRKATLYAHIAIPTDPYLLRMFCRGKIDYNHPSLENVDALEERAVCIATRENITGPFAFFEPYMFTHPLVKLTVALVPNFIYSECRELSVEKIFAHSLYNTRKSNAEYMAFVRSLASAHMARV